MKRIIISIIFLVVAALSSVSATVSAKADGESRELYAVADSRDVYFYSEPQENSGLFILPYTYYVKVISLGEPFCRVEYLDDAAPYRKITGYCKKSEITFVDFTPVRPFLRREVTVRYSIEGNLPTVGTGAFDSVEITYLYYGSYRAGTSLFHYVYNNGEFGYVPAAEELTYELNTDYLDQTSAETPPPQNDPAGSSPLTAVQITVICVLCVAVVGIAAFVLRGKRSDVRHKDETSDF